MIKARTYQLTSCVRHDINERIQWLVGESFLSEALADLLYGSCNFRHIQLRWFISISLQLRKLITHLVVTDNLRKSIPAASNYLLDDVAQVVDQEVECLATLSNGAKLEPSASPSLLTGIPEYLPDHQLHQ